MPAGSPPPGQPSNRYSWRSPPGPQTARPVVPGWAAGARGISSRWSTTASNTATCSSICEAYHLMRDLLGMSVEEMQQTFSRWHEGRLESYLIEITANILAYRDNDGSPLIDRILDAAGQKGTGKLTAGTALDYGIPLSLISESVFARCLSARRDERLTASRLLAGPEDLRYPDRERVPRRPGESPVHGQDHLLRPGYFRLFRRPPAITAGICLKRHRQIWRGGCIIRCRLRLSTGSPRPSAATPGWKICSLTLLFSVGYQGGQPSLRRLIARPPSPASPCSRMAAP